MVAKQDVILAAIDYEAAWNDYSISDAPNIRIAKGLAHQRLLDTVRAYVASQPEVVSIEPAIESNEARGVE